MTDWSKLKVVDLKEECKTRGIPLTGLKLKQQYIDKLEEHEAQSDSQPSGAAVAEEAAESEPQSLAHVNGGAPETEDARSVAPIDQQDEHVSQVGEAGEATPKQSQEQDSAVEKTDEPQQSEQPAMIEPAPVNGIESHEGPNAEDKPEAPMIQEAQPEQAAQSPVETETEKTVAKSSHETDHPEGAPKSALLSPRLSTRPTSDSSTPLSSLVPPGDLAEDQSRRRKRSATPVPTSEEIARKKLRLTGDADAMPADDASSRLSPRPAAETEAETSGVAPGSNSVKVAVEEGIPSTTAAETAVPEVAPPGLSEVNEKAASTSPRRSRSPSEDRDVPPAKHPATSSIYIRNFKRPLHVPTLRNHIVSVAKSRSSDEADPITTFYLDSIRTHAFVSFTSVAGASRVRSAMHETRFPDEPMRDPLFVDFVPDDKIQGWIDQETGSGFGRAGGGRRFEVVYDQVGDGVEAIFQEVGSGRPRPVPEPSRGGRMSIDQPRSEGLAQGVHPDRAVLVPREANRSHEGHGGPPTGPKNSSSSQGTGFKALDELFKSTSAKPKLYFKPVSDSVARGRLDLFRDLREGYEDLGRSGDEGMKRYSFEPYKDREEWVDKGPEFGHGKRGQVMLTGGGRGRGRGGGGGYRGRGGDSWRGGGR